MRILTLAILLLAMLSSSMGSTSVRQNGSESTQEIASLVSQLSWDSVGGECHTYWHISPDGEAAKKLVEIGKPATDELLKVLEDENKGVAAHIILSQIWEAKEVVYGSRIEGDKFIHIYNGLEWADILNMKEMSVKYKVKKFNLFINAGAWPQGERHSSPLDG